MWCCSVGGTEEGAQFTHPVSEGKEEKSGSGTDDVKKWKFFDVLNYMQPFLNRSSSSTLSNLLAECSEIVSAFLILFWVTV